MERAGIEVTILVQVNNTCTSQQVNNTCTSQQASETGSVGHISFIKNTTNRTKPDPNHQIFATLVIVVANTVIPHLSWGLGFKTGHDKCTE